MSVLSAHHTASVGECLPSRRPPPDRLFWSGLREGEVKGESFPLPLPDTGRSGIGKGGEGSQGRGDS